MIFSGRVASLKCVLTAMLSPLVLCGCMATPSTLSTGQLPEPDVRGQWHESAVDRLSDQQEALHIAVVETDVEIVLHRVVDDPRWLLSEQQKVGEAINHGLNTAIDDLGLFLTSNQTESHQLNLVQKKHSRPKAMIVDATELRFQASRLIDNHAQLAGIRDRGEFPSLGRAVLRLSTPLEADLILVSRYRGWRKTRGQWRKEKMSSSLFSLASLGYQNSQPLKEFGELEMLLLDGVNGNVLWRGHISGVPDAVVQAIPSAFNGCWQSSC